MAYPTIVLAELLRQASAATEWDGSLLERANERLPLLVKADAPLVASDAQFTFTDKEKF